MTEFCKPFLVLAFGLALSACATTSPRELTAAEKAIISDSIAGSIKDAKSAKFLWANFQPNATTSDGRVAY